VYGFIPNHLFYNNRNRRSPLHGIVGSYVLGTGGLVMIGASRTISGVFGIAAAGKCQGLLLINVTDCICNIGPFASIL
jgi:hypothetical protein